MSISITAADGVSNIVEFTVPEDYNFQYDNNGNLRGHLIKEAFFGTTFNWLSYQENDGESVTHDTATITLNPGSSYRFVMEDLSLQADRETLNIVIEAYDVGNTSNIFEVSFAGGGGGGGDPFITPCLV